MVQKVKGSNLPVGDLKSSVSNNNWVPFSNKGGIRQERGGMASTFNMPCPRYKGPPTPPLSPTASSGNLGYFVIVPRPVCVKDRGGGREGECWGRAGNSTMKENAFFVCKNY